MSRSTLAELRGVLRGMTEAGTADWTLGTATYWDDDHLDVVLDRYRDDEYSEVLEPHPIVGVGGTSLYYEYRMSEGNFEQTQGGTSIFYIQDATYATVGTANYSVDYLRGVVTFTSDTRGSTYYYTGRYYDLNSAAADIWRAKASHFYNAFSFTTDNHTINREQIYKHCIEMAEKYESMGEDSISTLEIIRSDTDAD